MLIDTETDIKICKIHGVNSFSIILTFLWAVGILYVTLGFRQFSHHFTGIRDALEEGDEDAARERLAHWQQVDVGALPRSEIVRHVIEYSVLAAHRHVFGVLAWFSVLAALGLGARFVCLAQSMHRGYSPSVSRAVFVYSIRYLSGIFAALLFDHYVFWPLA